MDTNSITSALKTALSSNLTGVIVERDEFVNDDPDKAVHGWVGVYDRTMQYDPLTLARNYAGRYNGTSGVLLVAQRVSYKSGEDAGVLINDLVADIVNVLIGTSLDTVVDHVKSINVAHEYNPRSEAGRVYFRVAYIEVEMEVQNA